MSMRYSSQFDLAKLKQNLFSKQKNLNREMHEVTKQGAERIMKKSQSNSPIDTYNLEEAHHITQTFTKADNIRYTVEVSGIGYGSDNPRDVSNYAMEVHENYENMGNGGHPKPGSKSADKKAAGHEVGSKFLERAVDSEKPAIIEEMRKAVRSFTRK